MISLAIISVKISNSHVSFPNYKSSNRVINQVKRAKLSQLPNKIEQEKEIHKSRTKTFSTWTHSPDWERSWREATTLRFGKRRESRRSCFQGDSDRRCTRLGSESRFLSQSSLISWHCCLLCWTVSPLLSRAERETKPGRLLQIGRWFRDFGSEEGKGREVLVCLGSGKIAGKLERESFTVTKVKRTKERKKSGKSGGTFWKFGGNGYLRATISLLFLF